MKAHILETKRDDISINYNNISSNNKDNINNNIFQQYSKISNENQQIY